MSGGCLSTCREGCLAAGRPHGHDNVQQRSWYKSIHMLRQGKRLSGYARPWGIVYPDWQISVNEYPPRIFHERRKFGGLGCFWLAVSVLRGVGRVACLPECRLLLPSAVWPSIRARGAFAADRLFHTPEKGIFGHGGGALSLLWQKSARKRISTRSQQLTSVCSIFRNIAIYVDKGGGGQRTSSSDPR